MPNVSPASYISPVSQDIDWDLDDTPEEEYTARRHQMVEQQLARRDIHDERVLLAMRAVPRHIFVPEGSRPAAYHDGPLSIGYGQTISQPYVVASMTEHLRLQPDSKVLEIGTGCGYQTAILAKLTSRVFSVEIVPELVDEARRLLKKLDCHDVKVKLADGALGWPEEAPFDAIIVTAAAPRLPEALVEQLAVGGRMVIPLATDEYGRQFLVRLLKTDSGLERHNLYEVRFVPMTGEVDRK